MNPASFFDREIDAASVPIADRKRKVFDRVMRSEGHDVFVLGRNKYAASVADQLDIAGFIDDTTDERAFLGKQVVRMADLPQDCAVVSCVVDGRPVTAIRRLEATGVRDVLDYFALVGLCPDRFRPIDYSQNNAADFRANRHKYDWLFERLADDASRHVLQRVIHFRLTGDLDAMAEFKVDFDRQYFESFVPAMKNAVFVDGGGFDGRTSLRFASRYPDYRRIYYFEPAPDMMSASRAALRELRSVTFIEKALSNSHELVHFDASAGSASHISQRGTLEIQATRLDDEIDEPVSFIKLDIEGAEYDAIAGAQQRISVDRPAMAVCVYHDQRDFWRVPERVLSYVDDYDVYLRHYTEGILETVMYFIPQN
jgi:FkbM family methyltransferase